MTFYIRSFITFFWIFLIFTLLWFFSIESPLKKEEKTLNVFCWSGQILPEIKEDFEKKTGTTVRLHYYTSNEELLLKLSAVKGKGYDLIIPSDYAIAYLIKKNLLKPLDKSKLNFLENLNPSLLGHNYDPQNIYSLPYQWEFFGLGIDSDYFEDRPFDASFRQIFDEKTVDYKISMVNDPIEAINFASFYLFGPLKHLEKSQVAKVTSLLKNQKKWVEAYPGIRGDYLLTTKNCQIALSPSSYIFRAAKNYPHIKFSLPKEWHFISIENICIPSGSEKDSLIYAFINHLFKPENTAKDCNTFLHFPATTDLYPYLEVSSDFKATLQEINKDKNSFYFFRHLIPEKEARKLWVKVKS